MSNQTSLETLGRSVELIQALLDDPQPGLLTWHMMLNTALEALLPAIPPIGDGPFSPSGEYTDLTNDPFQLDIVARKQEIFDFKELNFSITDGLGNLTDVTVGLGKGGTVEIRVASPLDPNGPDLRVKLFNAKYS